MDQNRDWKPIAALVLAGLALFVALSGPRGYRDDRASAAPQPIIVQPAAPSGGTTGGATAPGAPVIVVPDAQSGSHAGWRGGGHGFPFVPLLLLAGLVFLAFRLSGRGRQGWGGPGPQGPQAPQGPPAGQPYAQYPPQSTQGQVQGQPYGAYQQGPQPQAGQQGQQGEQGQPTRAMDAQGDITRPEGRSDY